MTFRLVLLFAAALQVAKAAPTITGRCELDEATVDSLTFTWSTVKSAGVLYTVGFSNGSALKTVNVSTVAIGNLVVGAFYSFRVWALDSSGSRSNNSINCDSSTYPDRPTILPFNNSEQKQTELTVSWSLGRTAVFPYTQVHVNYYNNATKSWIRRAVHNASITSVVIPEPGSTALVPGVVVMLNVSVESYGKTNSSEIVRQLTAPRLDPASCVLTNSTLSSLTFSWTAALSATQYVISNATLLRNVSSSLTVTINELNPATVYTFSLVAYGRSGLRSNEIICRNSTAPDIINIKNITEVTQNTMILSWKQDRSFVVNSTTVYHRVAGSDTQWSSTDVIPPDLQSVLVRNLTAGATHEMFVSVRSYDKTSNTSIIGGVATLPYSIGQCYIADSSPNHLTVEWLPSSPAGNDTSVYYTVSYLSQDDHSAEAAVVNTSDNRLVVNRLSAATMYTFNVTAEFNVTSTELQTTQLSCSGSTDPYSPTISSINKRDSILLKWTPDSTNHSVVFYCDVTFIPACPVYDSVDGVNGSALLSDLSPGHLYRFFVRVSSYNKYSLSQAPELYSAPLKPISVNVTAVNTSTVNVCLTPDPKSRQNWYKLQYNITDSNMTADFNFLPSNPLSTSCVIAASNPDERPGAQYTFYVHSVAGDVFSFTAASGVGNTVPLPPEYVFITPQTTNQFNINWNPSSSATSHNVKYERCDESVVREVSHSCCSFDHCTVNVSATDSPGSSYTAFVYSVAGKEVSTVASNATGITFSRKAPNASCGSATDRSVTLVMYPTDSVRYNMTATDCAGNIDSPICHKPIIIDLASYTADGLIPSTSYTFKVMEVTDTKSVDSSAMCSAQSDPYALLSEPLFIKCNTTAVPMNTETTPATTKVVDAPTQISPKCGRKFDGPSFVGGIILAAGLIVIGFVGFRIWRKRTAGERQRRFRQF